MTSMPRVARRGRRGLLLVSVVLLVAAWLITPAQSTPPLYDGVAFPDEPYRYVVPPPGAPATKPPTSATDDAQIVAGMSQLADAISAEQGPQVQFLIAQGEIAAPPGSTVVHLRADPFAPADQPTGATIWGNVYRLTAMSDRGPAEILVHARSVTQILLRAPVGPTPEPVMEYRDGTGWRRLPLTRAGNDIYSAPIAGVGDYAVATLPGNPQPVAGSKAPASPGGLDWWILVPAVALLVLIAGIVAIRRRRTHSGRTTTASAEVEALLAWGRMVASSAASIDLPVAQQAELRSRADLLCEATAAASPDLVQAHRLAEDVLALLRTGRENLASQAVVSKGEHALRRRRARDGR
jgi:hypothetical protein